MFSDYAFQCAMYGLSIVNTVSSWWCLCNKNEMQLPPEDGKNYAEKRTGKFVRALSGICAERCSENSI